MENNLKRVLDVRFEPSAYNWETKKEINRISLITADLFKTYISLQEEAFWMMPNTKILNIHCRGFQVDEYLNYTKIGDKKNGWISEVRVRMLEKEFTALEEKGKILLILDKIKEGFLKFVALFPEINFDTQKIENAYKRIIENDFYLRYTPSYFSKDNKYECWLELYPSIFGHKHQLVLIDSAIEQKYFIAQNEVLDVSSPTPPIEELLKPIKTLSIIGKGWRGHKFYFSYGEEKIIFNAETKTIEYKK